MKIVINRCYGGFGLSPQAEAMYLARKGQIAYFYREKRDSAGNLDFDLYEQVSAEQAKESFLFHTCTADYGSNPGKEKLRGSYFSGRNIERNDPDLITVVEGLGDEANGQHAQLEIIEIPDGINWEVDDYDGMETVEEQHRSWG